MSPPLTTSCNIKKNIKKKIKLSSITFNNRIYWRDKMVLKGRRKNYVSKRIKYKQIRGDFFFKIDNPWYFYEKYLPP
jgi:hypothetical protein